MSQADRAAAKDVVAAGMKVGAADQVVIPAPRFIWAHEHVRPVDGSIVTLDHGTFGNVVVNQGAAHILNRFFGGLTKSSAGVFLQLHSATTASNHVWSDISGSQVASYGNTLPLLTFATNGVARSTSTSCSYGFNAGTQTVSGACVQFYTTNTMSSNAATVDILHYSEGLFANSRQVINGDTLNVTLTVTYGT